jgi:Domain of unknown function (DUF4873)
MTEVLYDVAVVGVERAQGRLADAGITNVAVLDDCDLSGSEFDESTHTWRLPTCRARVVVTNQTRCGRENLTPYLGVAVHGAPNYFMITGDEVIADARLDYIADCLKLMQRTDSTRIEVLFSTQRIAAMRNENKPDRADASYWERMRQMAPTAFDVSSHIGIMDDLYDGAATLRLGDEKRQVRVRLSGHLDPIDGRYHWQGTVFDALPDGMLTNPRPVTVTIGDRSAEARITERTPQGRYSVAGVGAPPYALDDVEVVVPRP